MQAEVWTCNILWRTDGHFHVHCCYSAYSLSFLLLVVLNALIHKCCQPIGFILDCEKKYMGVNLHLEGTSLADSYGKDKLTVWINRINWIVNLNQALFKYFQTKNVTFVWIYRKFESSEFELLRVCCFHRFVRYPAFLCLACFCWSLTFSRKLGDQINRRNYSWTCFTYHCPCTGVHSCLDSVLIKLRMHTHLFRLLLWWFSYVPRTGLEFLCLPCSNLKQYPLF